MTDDYTSLTEQCKKMKESIKVMQIEETRLKSMIETLKHDLSASHSVNSSLSNSQVEMGNLKKRLKVLESL